MSGFLCPQRPLSPSCAFLQSVAELPPFLKHSRGSPSLCPGRRCSISLIGSVSSARPVTVEERQGSSLSASSFSCPLSPGEVPKPLAVHGSYMVMVPDFISPAWSSYLNSKLDFQNAHPTTALALLSHNRTHPTAHQDGSLTTASQLSGQCPRPPSGSKQKPGSGDWFLLFLLPHLIHSASPSHPVFREYAQQARRPPPPAATLPAPGTVVPTLNCWSCPQRPPAPFFTLSPLLLLRGSHSDPLKRQPDQTPPCSIWLPFAHCQLGLLTEAEGARTLLLWLSGTPQPYTLHARLYGPR